MPSGRPVTRAYDAADDLSWRGVALCLGIAHGGLLLRDEIISLAGARGVRSCARNVAAATRDFAPRVRWLYFPSSLYLTGERPELLLLYPELGHFRDLVFLFKLFMCPAMSMLPERGRWRAADARLRWRHSRTLMLWY